MPGAENIDLKSDADFFREDQEGDVGKRVAIHELPDGGYVYAYTYTVRKVNGFSKHAGWSTGLEAESFGDAVEQILNVVEGLTEYNKLALPPDEIKRDRREIVDWFKMTLRQRELFDTPRGVT